MRRVLRHTWGTAGAAILVALALFVFLSDRTPPSPDVAFAGASQCGSFGSTQFVSGGTLATNPEYVFQGESFLVVAYDLPTGTHEDVSEPAEVLLDADAGSGNTGAYIGFGSISLFSDYGWGDGVIPQATALGQHTITFCWLDDAAETWYYKMVDITVLGPGEPRLDCLDAGAIEDSLAVGSATPSSGPLGTEISIDWTSSPEPYLPDGLEEWVVDILWDWGPDHVYPPDMNQLIGEGTLFTHPEVVGSWGQADAVVPDGASPGSHVITVCMMTAFDEGIWYFDIPFTVASEPTPSPTLVPTDSPTPVPTDSPTPVPTNTLTATPTDAPTNTPTPTPTPTPTAAPPTLLPPLTTAPAPTTAAPTPTPTATATPTATPTTAPVTATDSPGPTATQTSGVTATPTQGFAPPTAVSANSTPAPTALADSGATATTAQTAAPSPTVLGEQEPPDDGDDTPAVIAELGGGNDSRPEIVRSVPKLGDLSGDLGIILTNVVLGGITLVLMLLTAEIFNQTLEENEGDIKKWFRRISGPLKGLFGVIGDMGRMITDGRGVAGLLAPIVLLALAALLYGLEEPGYGINNQSVVIFISFLAAFAVLTYVYDGGQLLMTNSYGIPGSIRLFPAGIFVALFCIAMTRLMGFQPGIIYGFIAAHTLVAGSVITRDQEGRQILFPAIALLTICAAAFLLLAPARDLATDNNSLWASIPEGVAVGIFVGGLEGMFFQMVPIKWMDGHRLWAWSKLVWLGVTGVTAFLFWHVLLNAERQSFDTLSETTPAIALLFMGICFGLTLAMYLFFRIKNARAPSPA